MHCRSSGCVHRASIVHDAYGVDLCDVGHVWQLYDFFLHKHDDALVILRSALDILYRLWEFRQRLLTFDFEEVFRLLLLDA